MRKQIAAANWKMNLTVDKAETLINDIVAANMQLGQDQLAVFAVPAPYLQLAQKAITGKENYFIAAQNCYSKKSGAYTGEVSVEMLQSIGIQFVLLGHSERREYFNEDNKTLSQKVDVCLKNNLKPIFCCGESLEIRESEKQNEFVENQLNESLFHLESSVIENFVIAYEPIWAIGTGKTASAEQAQEMHAYIRSVLISQYGKDVSETISILYGGSVKANNAKEIFGKPDVDGGLIGGASLHASEFAEIIGSLK